MGKIKKDETLFDKLFKNVQQRRVYHQECSLCECTEAIVMLMEQKKITLDEVVNKSGKSKKFITDFLADKAHDISMRDFADIMFGLGVEFKLKVTGELLSYYDKLEVARIEDAIEKHDKKFSNPPKRR